MPVYFINYKIRGNVNKLEIARLTIENFRGIKNGEIYFNGHTLLIGGNNTGKSTICEALNLVLSTDRLNQKPVVNEHDFYQSKYLDDAENEIKIKIEVILINLSKEVKNQFHSNIEYWDKTNKKLLNHENSIQDTDKASNNPALRVAFEGWYSKEEDDFYGKTVFANPQVSENENPVTFSRKHKKEFGYLYLRALRTGRRALSLEKGSLLDILLRLNDKTPFQMWTGTIDNLETLNPPIHEITQLKEILQRVYDRVKDFVSLSEKYPLSLYVSQLTREHLREIITLFMSSKHSSQLLPYYRMGMGTINAFVFSLLSFIAELKNNVIFSMEEPEIAIPPHTQRRLIRFCLEKMNQFLVTSHSPYVIEQFKPEQIVLLQRKNDGSLKGNSIQLKDLKLKTFQGRLRKQFAEAMLGEGVLVVEGKTEENIFPVASSILEKHRENYRSLDLTGVTVVSADGNGNLMQIGKFFKSLNLKCYAFFDKQKNEEQINQIGEIFNKYYEIPDRGIEKFLVNNIDINIQKKFIMELRVNNPDGSIPPIKELSQTEEIIKKEVLNILTSKKGEGYSAKLISLCNQHTLPKDIKQVLIEIEKDFLNPNVSEK